MNEQGNGASGLHPAEHRAYRELYASAHQLLVRWRRLSDALADTSVAAVLDHASHRVHELLAEVEPRTAAHDLHGGPAAQGVGARLGELRTAIVDRSVDTGMALRLAVLDVEHLTTLMLQLAELAAARHDRAQRDFCAAWAKRLRPEVKAVRRAAAALGSDPDRAAAPLDDSPLGQIVHRAGWAVGTLGEWFDRQIGGRESQR